MNVPLRRSVEVETGTIAPMLIDEPEARRNLGGLCPKTMYNLRKQGLPFVKIGRRTMYDLRDLAAWIERQKGASE